MPAGRSKPSQVVRLHFVLTAVLIKKHFQRGILALLHAPFASKQCHDGLVLPGTNPAKIFSRRFSGSVRAGMMPMGDRVGMARRFMQRITTVKMIPVSEGTL